MKNLIVLLCSIWLAGTGCKKIDKLTQFNMEFNESITISSGTSIDLPFNVLTPDIQTNSSSTFAVNNTRKELIEEVKLTNMTLVVKSPSNGTFSFLKSINIYIVADGLPEVKIAWKENIPNTVGATLSLDVSDTNLKDYIIKDKFNLKLSTVTDEIIATDYQIDIKSVFFVDAKILGQ